MTEDDDGMRDARVRAAVHSTLDLVSSVLAAIAAAVSVAAAALLVFVWCVMVILMIPFGGRE